MLTSFLLPLALLGCNGEPADTGASSDDTVSAVDDTGTAGDDTGTADQNQPPSAPSVEISPADPMYDEDLLCEIIADAVDPDGDAVSYSYAWTVDGVALDVDGETVPASMTAPWQSWSCEVTASDGQDDASASAASVLVGEECVGLELDESEYAIATDMGGDSTPFMLGSDGGQLTVELWFYANASGGYDSFAYMGPIEGDISTRTIDWRLYYNADELVWATGDRDQDPNCADLKTAQPSAGEWHHLAATIDTDTREKQLFVDGELVGSCTYTHKVSQPGVGLQVGGVIYFDSSNYPTTTGRCYGQMDEMRISSAVRYDGDFEPPRWSEPDADTLALWHFNEGSGTEAEDDSGNGHTLGLNQITWSEGSACDAD